MFKHQDQIPVIQIVGYKNSGKTTLMTRLIKHLTSHHQLSIFTIKHDHGHFELDWEGSDTWAHRQAGARTTLIQSPHGIGLTMTHQKERTLEELLLLARYLGDYDLALVEGFKQADYPKLVLVRHQADFGLLEQLSHIRLAVFWREIDRLHYERQCDRQGIAPLPTGLLTETDKLLNRIETMIR
ncbi:molybdopterin-guanine dinucleotide biosynthesis protein B [Caldalkalibacillus thermarum TA2.A1]|uniref:Molybdopterin-guanine dinucleotide biosynthesis protein B n=1 Tax=Caldalkalibacillus thermarum (strain TA2.A1) TaxID=986075 RepID=A0A8X8I2N4_CALTT|nr:molybdopterin-guanine dinucleotide biosynthesis protein B [Caldalkalibacillus thermarum]QZT33210.1 molybdopterin-guanine dinucleotide biosynthesis protein B [Caldalkalibacillus thermarum TA2.A1]